MRRLRLGVPVVAGAIVTLFFPPVILILAFVVVRERIRAGGWGYSLAFLSRTGRRGFLALWTCGFVAVCAAYGSAIAGHGGTNIAAMIGGIVTVGLLAVVANDLFFGGAMVAANAAGRRQRRRRR